jgi:hypothetical protein
MPLPRNFPTPQHLRDAFDKYKEWAKTNPLKVHDYVGKDAKEVFKEKERPLSLDGFEAWCYREELGTVEQYFANTGDMYNDYLSLCRAIRKEIRADQIDGGMAGVYNPSITQRLNNLNETQTIEHKGNLPEWMKK